MTHEQMTNVSIFDCENEEQLKEKTNCHEKKHWKNTVYIKFITIIR